MVQLSGGIGNVRTNTELVEMAMAYSRSPYALRGCTPRHCRFTGDELRSVGFLAENCQADAHALYRLLQASPACNLSIYEEAL
jgi:hypothetical protein